MEKKYSIIKSWSTTPLEVGPDHYYLRIEFGEGYPSDFIDVELFERGESDGYGVRIRGGRGLVVHPEESNVIFVEQTK